MKRFTLLFFSITILFILLVSLSNCGKEKTDPLPTTTPTVVTGDVTSITTTSATGSGQIVSDGNVTVSERGVVIGKTADPTINDTKVLSGKGAGTFSVEVTGLTSNTTYHLRAFGTNAKGTSYGLDKLFTTSSTLPTVTTSAVSTITLTAASSGGIITSDGGAAITARGICWSTTSNPTITNSKTTDGSGEGTFTSNLISLNSGTKYYVRAYATNSVGTAYGNELNFTTPTSPIPANGLVGWWPFNGNANDESGNGNNGTTELVTLNNDRFGNANSSYSFTNGLSKITISNTFFDNGWRENTISFWFYPSQLNNGVIMNTIPHDGTAFAYSRYGTNKKLYFVKNADPNKHLWNIIGADLGNSEFMYPEFNFNTWYFVSVTKLNNTYTFYVNGSIDKVVTLNVTPISFMCSFIFGNISPIPANSPEPFYGSLDDIAIWNRALTADEILKIYNGTGF